MTKERLIAGGLPRAMLFQVVMGRQCLDVLQGQKAHIDCVHSEYFPEDRSTTVETLRVQFRF